MLKKFLVATSLLLVTLAPIVCFSQDDTDPEATGDPLANDLPFDGGVSILVASGISYGLYKMKNKKPITSESKENPIV